MGEDTYKGESLAKKRARICFWLEAIEASSSDGPMVVLASREMGDYGVLSQIDPRRKVISVDRCADAVHDATRKYPSADVRLGDVATIVANLAPPLGGAFLDFCSPICPEAIKSIVAVASHVEVGGVFGVGLLKGREKDGAGTIAIRDTGRNRQIKRRLERRNRLSPAMVAVGEANVGGGPLYARTLGAMFREELGGEDPGVLRAIAVQALTHPALAKLSKTALQARAIYNYQSATKNSNGVPMTYVLYRVVKAPRVERGYRNQLRVVGDDLWPSNVRLHNITADDSWLRQSIDWAEQDGLDPCPLHNVSRGTISAWKAHATRGTYAKKGAA